MMKENGQITKGKMDTKEELLNFDLEDLTSPGLDEDLSEENEEIIDLIELVEKGDDELIQEDQLKRSGEGKASWARPELELETDEIGEIQELSPGEDAPKGSNVLDLSDITLELSQAEGKKRAAADVSEQDEITEADLEGLLVEETEETVRLDLEGSERPETPRMGEEEDVAGSSLEGLLEEFEDEKQVEEEEETESEPEGLSLEEEEITRAGEGGMGIEAPVGIEKTEELKRTPADLEKALEMTPKEPAMEKPLASLQEIGGISEEKLEAAITRVVEDVVERVARETMANVAEKLITEAIEALKKSIESSPRG
jgi:hypothetical protein